jgi:surfactin synthase thioesterase subunit
LGGIEDANVGAAQLEPWREHTTARFTTQQFPGGHFFLQESADFVLNAVVRLALP